MRFPFQATSIKIMQKKQIAVNEQTNACCTLARY